MSKEDSIMAEEKQYSQSITTDQVKTLVQQRVKAAMDKAKLEIAEPEGWWDLYALGPFQFTGVGGPLLPHKVIKVGESFYVATVLFLNPFLVLPGGVTVCQLISNLACDFQLEYCTADMCRVVRSGQFSRGPVAVPLEGDDCFYVDVQQFTATAGTESCIHEMNICARITGCREQVQAPPLAGHATAVVDFDPDLILNLGAPRLERMPIRFQVYAP
jgi:hypothetical protein